MNTQIISYDNRGTALHVRHLREAREWRVDPEQPLHPVWLWIAISLGLSVGVLGYLLFR